MGQDCILRAGFQPAPGGLPTRRTQRVPLPICPTILAKLLASGKVCGIGQSCQQPPSKELLPRPFDFRCLRGRLFFSATTPHQRQVPLPYGPAARERFAFGRLFRVVRESSQPESPAESRRQPRLAAPQPSAYSLLRLPQPLAAKTWSWNPVARALMHHAQGAMHASPLRGYEGVGAGHARPGTRVHGCRPEARPGQRAPRGPKQMRIESVWRRGGGHAFRVAVSQRIVRNQALDLLPRRIGAGLLQHTELTDGPGRPVHGDHLAEE